MWWVHSWHGEKWQRMPRAYKLEYTLFSIECNSNDNGNEYHTVEIFKRIRCSLWPCFRLILSHFLSRAVFLYVFTQATRHTIDSNELQTRKEHTQNIFGFQHSSMCGTLFIIATDRFCQDAHSVYRHHILKATTMNPSIWSTASPLCHPSCQHYIWLSAKQRQLSRLESILLFDSEMVMMQTSNNTRALFTATTWIENIA